MTVTAHSRRLDCRSVLTILALLWILMTLWDFGLPGLYFDEVNHYAFIPGILSEEAARLPHYRLADNWFDLADGAKRFPILGGTVYNSVIRSYLGLPYFLFTGFSVEALRIFSAVLGLAALLSASSLVGRLFGWLPALVFGLVVATDPTNVFSLRSQGGLFWLIVLFTTVAGHALLYAARADGPPRPWTAIVSGASIALAVSSYFVGVFAAVPLVACGIMVFRRHPWRLFAFLAAGVLAFAPVLYALASIYLQAPAHFSDFGHPSLTRERTVPLLGVENLGVLFNKLQGAIGSHRYAQYVVGDMKQDFSMPRLLAIAISIFTLLVLAARRRLASGQQAAFYLVVTTTAAIYLAATFVLSSLGMHHLLPFSVLVAMVMASLIASKGIARHLALAACAVMLATNSAMMVNAHESLRRTGGAAYHNETYSLHSPLLATALSGYYPVFASWGFHLQFLFQTRGEVPYAAMTKPNPKRIRELLQRHGQLAVVVNRQERRQFLAAFRPEQELRFSQRDGHYLYSIMLLREGAPGPGMAAPSATEGHELRIASTQEKLCRESDGATTANVSWDVASTSIERVSIHVARSEQSPFTLWRIAGDNGAATTGPWIRIGTVVELRDESTGDVLDRVTVQPSPGC